MNTPPPSNRNNDDPLYKYRIATTSDVPGLDSYDSKEIYDKLKNNNMLFVFDLSYEEFLRFLYNNTFIVDKNQNFRNIILGQDNEDNDSEEKYCENLIELDNARLYLISMFLKVSHAKNIQAVRNTMKYRKNIKNGTKLPASVQKIVEGYNNRKFNRMGGSKKKVSKKKLKKKVSKKKSKKKVSKKKVSKKKSKKKK
jgi:hypothetical protein